MIDSLSESSPSQLTQLEQRQRSAEYTAANVYNQTFNKLRSFQWLDRCKKIPFLRSYIDKIQAVQLTMNEQAALEQAGFDSKTGLLNASGINHLATEAAKELSHNPDQANNEEWAILFIDVNWFKKFNDILGQSEGDEYLCEIAKILGNSVRFGVDDLVGRHGGEEFVMLIRTKRGMCRSVIDKDDASNPGILQRLATRTQVLRTTIANAKEDFSQQKIEYDQKSLKEMGVGTLAVGIDYWSGEDVVKNYQIWEQQSKLGLTEKDFLNFVVINKGQDYVKKYAKQVAHEKQGDTPVWVTMKPEFPTDQIVTRPISGE